MILFSKKVVIHDYEEQKAAVILETTKLSKALAEKVNELNRINDELALKKLTSERDFQNFIEPLSRTRDSLSTEVQVLEARKKEAMRPLEELKERLRKAEDETSERMVELANKEVLASQLVERRDRELAEAKKSLAIALKEKEEASSFKTSAEQSLKDAHAAGQKIKERAEEIYQESLKHEASTKALEELAHKQNRELSQRETAFHEQLKELKAEEDRIIQQRLKLRSALDLMKAKEELYASDQQLLPRRKQRASGPRGKSKRDSSASPG